MSEQDDKLLHDWVRQSLDNYRPPYSPNDWADLQRTLRRKRWWRNGLIGSSVTVFLIGSLSWFLLIRHTENSPTIHPAKQASKKPAPESITLHSTNGQPRLVHYRLTVNRKKSVAATKINSADSPQSTKPPLVEWTTFLSGKNQVSLLPVKLSEQIQSVTAVGFSTEEKAIERQMVTGDFGSDSTSYRILARNLRLWPKAVFVCDLTTSMYPYTTQLFALLKQYAQAPSILGTVFFTDCDSLGQQTRMGGPPGRMFVLREQNITVTLPLLVQAARNTVRNEDDAENDIEALLFAQTEFPEASHLILVADNISAVKDMALLKKIRKPVHVLLCGTTGSDSTLALQPDYYTIAKQTNGSLHTLEDDFSPKTVSSTTTLQVGNHYYRYSVRQKKFKLTPFTHRPRRFLGFIWL